MAIPPLDLALDLSSGPAQGGTSRLDGAFGDFNFKGSSRRGGMPTWALIGGGLVLAFVLLRRRK